MGIFEKKPVFQKSDKGSKVAEECDWTSKLSQNVQVLALLKNKTDRFSEKKDFLKNRRK